MTLFSKRMYSCHLNLKRTMENKSKMLLSAVVFIHIQSTHNKQMYRQAKKSNSLQTEAVAVKSAWENTPEIHIMPLSHSFSSEKLRFYEKDWKLAPCSKPRYTKATYNHALSHGVARTQSTVSIKRLVLPWEHPNLESFETMSSLFNQNLISNQCSPVAIPLITLIKPYNIVSCKLLHTLAIDSCASMRMKEAQGQISRPSLVFMM